MGWFSNLKNALGEKPRKSEPRSSDPIAYFDAAFDAATSSITWPDGSGPSIRRAIRDTFNEGEREGTKALQAVWPKDVAWPDATAYLEAHHARVADKDYMQLLRQQVIRVTYQMHRIEQMNTLYETSFGKQSRGTIEFRGGSENEGAMLCGKRDRELMSADEFLAGKLTPCLVVGCDCQWFTVSQRDLERRRNA